MSDPQDWTPPAVRRLLWSALSQPFSEHIAQQALRDAAIACPSLFFEEAFNLLETLPDSPLRPHAYARLLGCQELLVELVSGQRYTPQELFRRCAEWIRIDGLLDVRLAQLLPGRYEDPVGLPAPIAVLILDILHGISTGPRLIRLVNHLKHHSDPAVAEKATLLVARRIGNVHWIEAQLASADPCIRAAAVEGLWGSVLPATRRLLGKCRLDPNHRVAGNALLGLHYLGEIKVTEWVREMIKDPRAPFRRTAAWLMGQMGYACFLDDLEAGLADSELGVRLSAQKALDILRYVLSANEDAARAAAEPPDVRPPQQPQKAFLFRLDGSFVNGS